MPYGMYISAAGAQAQSQRLQVLSNNLANVDTPGFKQQLAVLQARHSEAIEQGLATPGSRGIDDIGGGVKVAETITDFAAGTMQPTGNATDLAIDGDGFFLVEKDGEQLLTRAGNFNFSSRGRLETDVGDPVLSAAGAPIHIDPALPWRILENGSVFQAGTQTPLALVRPQSLGDLARAGENTFSPLAEVLPVAADQRRIQTGFIEKSSVNPAVEMMDMIETSRAYEANVRLIQNHDHMIGSLVNRVLRQG